MIFVGAAVLILLGMSVLGSDGRWGRGVRGAVSELRADQPGGVRGRLSAAAEGARLGWRDKTPSTRRTVGKTPPQDTLLSGVLRRLVDLSERGVRAIKDAVSGPHEDTSQDSRAQMLLVDADGRGRYVDVDETDPYPDLEPGQRLHHLGQNGEALPEPWTYDDQQEERAASGATEPLTEEIGGDVFLTLTCCELSCSTSRIFRAAREGRGGLSWEVIKANWLIVDEATGDGWCPQHRPDKDTYTPYDADSPETRAFMERALQAKLAHLERFDPEATDPVASRSHEGDTTMTAPTTQQAGSIENLNDYKRYLTGALTAVQAELDDAQAGVRRHQALATSIAEGASRLIALEVDRQTVAEAMRVADQAQVAKERSQELAKALADAADALTVALDGCNRHSTAQDIHDAGLLAKKPAYNGS